MEKQGDELFKRNRRRQERIERAIEERRARGDDPETAFRDAPRDVVPELADDESERSDEPWLREESESLDRELENTVRAARPLRENGTTTHSTSTPRNDIHF